MKSIRELASKVAKLEGKKSETSIGNIREILKIVSDLIAQDASALHVLLKNGYRRKYK